MDNNFKFYNDIAKNLRSVQKEYNRTISMIKPMQDVIDSQITPIGDLIESYFSNAYSLFNSSALKDLNELSKSFSSMIEDLSLDIQLSLAIYEESLQTTINYLSKFPNYNDFKDSLNTLDNSEIVNLEIKSSELINDLPVSEYSLSANQTVDYIKPVESDVENTKDISINNIISNTIIIIGLIINLLSCKVSKDEIKHLKKSNALTAITLINDNLDEKESAEFLNKYKDLLETIINDALD